MIAVAVGVANQAGGAAPSGSLAVVGGRPEVADRPGQVSAPGQSTQRHRVVKIQVGLIPSFCQSPRWIGLAEEQALSSNSYKRSWTGW